MKRFEVRERPELRVGSRTNGLVRATVQMMLSCSLLMLPSCSREQESTERTREVVSVLFEAFNAHDLDAVMELYHPQVKKMNPTHPEPIQGKDAVREIYSGLFGLVGVHDSVNRVVVDGDQAAVEFTASWFAPAEGGTRVRREMRIAAFLRVRDGKIIEDVTYYDPADLTPPSG